METILKANSNSLTEKDFCTYLGVNQAQIEILNRLDSYNWLNNKQYEYSLYIIKLNK